MKTFLSHIEERVSDIVFHFTSIYNAKSIVESGLFRLSTHLGTSADRLSHKKEELFFFSLARTPFSSFIDPYWEGVMFELDGRALSAKYRGAPVDYWGAGWQKSEAEDRIFSREQHIPLLPYTSAVHIYYRDETGDMDRHSARIHRIKDIVGGCLKKKIPVFVYDDVNSFKSRRNPIPLQQFISTVKSLKKVEHSPFFRFRRSDFDVWVKMAMFPIDEMMTRGMTKDALGELIKARLGDRAYRKIWDLRGYRNDNISSLSADIHNNKNKESVMKLVKAFRHVGADTSEQFIDKLIAKWEPYLEMEWSK